MPAEDQTSRAPDRAATLLEGEVNSLDELAKGLASGAITRRRALKLVGMVVLGGVAAGLFPGVAEANTCGPGNCAGCCDKDGVCQLGTSTLRCGSGGIFCGPCALNAQCVPQPGGVSGGVCQQIHAHHHRRRGHHHHHA